MREKRSGPGRPKVPPEESRSNVIRVYLNDRELSELQRERRMRDTSESAVMREAFIAMTRRSQSK